MTLFEFNITLRLPPEFVIAVDRVIAAINLKGNAIMNDLKKLEDTITALETKVIENNATLAGLAQAIIDLKATGDVQAGIDALAARAQSALDALSTAEDAADDQLPTPPTTPA